MLCSDSYPCNTTSCFQMSRTESNSLEAAGLTQSLLKSVTNKSDFTDLPINMDIHDRGFCGSVEGFSFLNSCISANLCKQLVCVIVA